VVRWLDNQTCSNVGLGPVGPMGLVVGPVGPVGPMGLVVGPVGPVGIIGGLCWLQPLYRTKCPNFP
jgi:hypothetical protein